jgi:hypothetical protein
MRYLPLLALLIACADPAQDTSSDELIWTELAPPAAQTLALTGPPTARIGGTITFTVTGAAPGEQVLLLRGTGVGSGPCTAVTNQCASLSGTRGIVARATADGAGTATLTVRNPANTPLDREAWFQATALRGPNNANTVVSNVERARASDGSARVRVVHASSDAPAVDIYANGALLVPNLPYLGGTPYVHVPANTYTVDIRGAGAPANSPPVYSVTLPLNADVDYTAIAAGFLGSSTPADAFRVLALVDDFGSPSADTFRARIVHAGADAPTVGIDVGNDGSNEITGLARFADTGAAGVALPAGTSLQAAATAPGAAFPFTLPAFAGDTDILVVATGTLGARANQPDAFGLLALDESGVIGFVRQNPVVYAFHASPDAPTVDVKVGGATIADDLSFRELSGRIQVPPAAYTLDIYDGSGQTYVTSITTPDLQPGESYLAIATGFLSGVPAFQPAYFADSAIITPGSATVQVIHASPDAPAVSVGALLPTFVDLTGPISFPNEASPDGVTVAPGTYDLAVALPAGPVLFEFPGIPLAADDRYLAVANGSLGAADFGVTLIDVTAQPWAAATVFPAP